MATNSYLMGTRLKNTKKTVLCPFLGSVLSIVLYYCLSKNLTWKLNTKKTGPTRGIIYNLNIEWNPTNNPLLKKNTCNEKFLN